MSESVFADRIVQNLLDTDFYKLTMMQAVLHNYPNVEVEWEFRCRNSEDLRPYLAEIRYQIERLAELSLSPDQLGFLERISFMKPDFLRFLGLFRFNLRYVQTGIENGELFIRLRGPWLHVILFEVPMLAIVFIGLAAMRMMRGRTRAGIPSAILGFVLLAVFFWAPLPTALSSAANCSACGARGGRRSRSRGCSSWAGHACSARCRRVSRMPGRGSRGWTRQHQEQQRQRPQHRLGAGKRMPDRQPVGFAQLSELAQFSGSLSSPVPPAKRMQPPAPPRPQDSSRRCRLSLRPGESN